MKLSNLQIFDILGGPVLGVDRLLAKKCVHVCKTLSSIEVMIPPASPCPPLLCVLSNVAVAVCLFSAHLKSPIIHGDGQWKLIEISNPY